MLKRPLIASIAVLACLVPAAPASAALSGNWAGGSTQDLEILSEPYTTTFVVTVYKGRLTGVVGTLRMECLSGILDGRVNKGWRTGKGPKIEKGTFAVTVNGIRVSGHLNSSSGAGSMTGSKSGCEGTGTWSVRKRKL